MNLNKLFVNLYLILLGMVIANDIQEKKWEWVVILGVIAALYATITAVNK